MIEYERKYLVESGQWLAELTKSVAIRQAYLAVNDLLELRVRIESSYSGEEKATLCIKGREAGGARTEFEWNILSSEAETLMGMSRGQILNKTRRQWDGGDGGQWTVDVFGGFLQGLIIAEWECSSLEQLERGPVDVPIGILREVTDDTRFRNEYLSSTVGLTVESLMTPEASV